MLKSWSTVTYQHRLRCLRPGAGSTRFRGGELDLVPATVAPLGPAVAPVERVRSASSVLPPIPLPPHPLGSWGLHFPSLAFAMFSIFSPLRPSPVSCLHPVSTYYSSHPGDSLLAALFPSFFLIINRYGCIFLYTLTQTK